MMDESEISKDVNFLLESAPSNSMGKLMDQQQSSTLPLPKPKRTRTEDAFSKGKILLCFFPNSVETRGLMQAAAYSSKYEMIVPNTWKLGSVRKKLLEKWKKIESKLQLQARTPTLSPILENFNITLIELCKSHMDTSGSISFEYSWVNVGKKASSSSKSRPSSSSSSTSSSSSSSSSSLNISVPQQIPPIMNQSTHQNLAVPLMMNNPMTSLLMNPMSLSHNHPMNTPIAPMDPSFLSAQSLNNNTQPQLALSNQQFFSGQIPVNQLFHYSFPSTNESVNSEANQPKKHVQLEQSLTPSIPIHQVDQQAQQAPAPISNTLKASEKPSESNPKHSNDGNLLNHSTFEQFPNDNLTFGDPSIGMIGENTCMEVFGALGGNPSDSLISQSSFRSEEESSSPTTTEKTRLKQKKRIAPTLVSLPNQSNSKSVDQQAQLGIAHV